MANDERGSLLQRHLLLEQALCDPRTSKGDCQVLAMIAAHADRDTGQAWPGVNRIAKRAGIHRSTVLASVGRLQDWGYVTVHRERGRANVYRLATSSAHATSQTGELVAPTLPVPKADQSRPRDHTSSAHATGLVAPALPDQSRPRYPNSAFELGSLTQRKNSVACGAQPMELEQQEPEREAEAAAKEARITARARDTYLAAKDRGDTAAMAVVERAHRERIADLLPGQECQRR